MLFTRDFTCPLPNDGNRHTFTTDDLMELLSDTYDRGYAKGKDDCKTELSTITVSSDDKNYAFMTEYCTKCSVKFCDPHKKACLENCMKFYNYNTK